MRLFKEPLFHFFLLAVAIFGWYALRTPPAPVADRTDIIVIDERDVERMLEQYKAVWNRPPSTEELQALVDNLLREEILVREAEAMGLQTGDTVIRGRLRQKMEFLTTSVAQSIDPEDAVLQEHLDKNAERFRTPGAAAFAQVYLGQKPDPALAAEVRTAVQSGADPASLGERSLLPASFPLSPEQTIDSTFGRGFFGQVFDLPTGTWEGPVQSGYGDHLVQVMEKTEGSLPPLDSIRDEVLFDWRKEMSLTLSDAQVAGLQERYEIVRPDLSQWADEVRK